MALVSTSGAADANSYASRVEADAYSVGLTDAQLILATRLLDAWPRAWTGAALLATQALGWPRVGMLSRNGFAIPADTSPESIPVDLKNAELEFAVQLKADPTRTEDDAVTLSRLRKLKAGSLEIEFAARSEERLALQRRDSLEALVPDLVIMLLVPSWLKDVRDEDLLNTFIFESLEE